MGVLCSLAGAGLACKVLQCPLGDEPRYSLLAQVQELGVHVCAPVHSASSGPASPTSSLLLLNQPFVISGQYGPEIPQVPASCQGNVEALYRSGRSLITITFMVSYKPETQIARDICLPTRKAAVGITEG